MTFVLSFVELLGNPWCRRGHLRTCAVTSPDSALIQQNASHRFHSPGEWNGWEAKGLIRALETKPAGPLLERQLARIMKA